MSKFFLLDTETTGLDPEKHQVWEIGWAELDGPIRSMILPHDLRQADPKALSMNGYYERNPEGTSNHFETRNDLYIRELLEGATICCANPTFDRMFLRARWGYEPWHHRSVDIESMAMLVFLWDKPRGLKDVAEELRSLGYKIYHPDHSAAGDVKTLRDCYKALREESRR